MKAFIRDLMYDRIDGFWITLMKRNLWVFSKLFGVIIAVRNWLFRIGWKKSYAVARPVISVGNITVGGVGKTPMVIFLAEEIKKMGQRPAILTRGYMQDTGSGSDEAQMMLHKLKDVPVIVGANRVQEARDFLKDDDCDVFIMDDGFQHRKLKRDLDIVLMDATNPWGNGHLIPRGILREPLKALERADAIILTRTDQAEEQVKNIQRTVHAICPDKLFATATHAPRHLYDLKTKERIALESLQGKSVYAFSSIAHPQAFERSLMHLGAEVEGSSHFLDHHVYTEENMGFLLDDIRFQNTEVVVTTEKDEPKLEQWVSQMTDLTVLSLRIEMVLQTGKEELLGRAADLLDH